MRFLVDECVSSAVTQYLRANGHEILAVAEVTPRANDTDILNRAFREQRILITNDKDFGELVFRSGQAHQGVLLLRLRDESPANQIAVLEAVLQDYSDQLPGQFAIVSERNIRIRGTVTWPLNDEQENE
jgi:predicted nuclease of predicted toxin-antitoxin system